MEMVELLIMPGAIMLFLLTWAAAETAVFTTMRNQPAKPRVEPLVDMSPLTGKRNPWYAVWA
jgi:hypothetical protein